MPVVKSFRWRPGGLSTRAGLFRRPAAQSCSCPWLWALTLLYARSVGRARVEFEGVTTLSASPRRFVAQHSLQRRKSNGRATFRFSHHASMGQGHDSPEEAAAKQARLTANAPAA